MGKTPGQVHTEKAIEACYGRYPDLDARITEHITKWRDSVHVGTVATIADMMNFEAPGRHGLPGEVVLAIVFPEYGECPIEGVKGVTAQLTPEGQAAGYAAPKFIQRIS